MSAALTMVSLENNNPRALRGVLITSSNTAVNLYFSEIQYRGLVRQSIGSSAKSGKAGMLSISYRARPLHGYDPGTMSVGCYNFILRQRY
jgi:hypothetical protein